MKNANTDSFNGSRLILKTAKFWSALALLPLVAAEACGGSDLSCGEGTERKGDQCVTATFGLDGGPIAAVTLEFDGITSAAPAAADAVQLTWLPATHPRDAGAIIRYALFASTESANQNFTEPLAYAPPGSTSFRIEGLDAEEWFFVVRAVADDGGAIDENTVEKSTTPSVDTTPPTFGGLVSVESAGSASVRVTWEAANDDKTPPEGLFYQVSWSDGEGRSRFGQFGAISLPGATSVVVPKLPVPEQEYYFHVKAIDAAGNTDDNEVERSGTAGPDTVPPVFGGCTAATDPTAIGATIAWDPAVDDTTPSSGIKYNVYAFEIPVDHNTNFGEPAGVFEGGATTVKLEGLQQSTTYRVVCRAEDAHGNEDDNLSVRTFTTQDDGTPPTFVGLETVVARATEADLSWEAATDDQTEQSDIVYEVYAANESGSQAFDAEPLAESPPGSTGITLFGLDSNSDYHFVVRARDRAGNVDTNTRERSERTLVSFMLDVQPIFTDNCALSNCHVPGNPPQGQILSEGYAYANIVDLPSVEYPSLMRIDSSSPDPEQSYLYRKITNCCPTTGSPMPPPIAQRVLSEEQKDTIRLWIVQGSQNN